MSDVFKNQKLLTIKLDCMTSLTNATGFKILYKKPSGATGAWDASQDGTSTRIMVTCEDGKIDQAGIWQFQAYYTENTVPVYGDIVGQEFKEPIKSL